MADSDEQSDSQASPTPATRETETETTPENEQKETIASTSLTTSATTTTITAKKKEEEEDDDLSPEQTEKLMQFQEITQTESLDQCKQLLEAFEWNVESAVSNSLNEQLITPQTTSNSRSFGATTTTTTTTSTSTTNSRAESTDLLDRLAMMHQMSEGDRTIGDSSSDEDEDDEVANRTFSDLPPPPQAPPLPPSALSMSRTRTTSINNANSLPNVNVHTQRTLSYNSPRANTRDNAAVVPQGFFQWSVFLVSMPFKFIFSTLIDLAGFFGSILFDSDPRNGTIGGGFNAANAIDYDPLVNIAEYAIQFNTKYGTEHPTFYEGSYSQAVQEAKRDLKFVLVYVHQNDQRDCTTFAQETLQDPDLVRYINNNFLFWSCSRDLPEGAKVFQALKARRAPFLGVIVLKYARMTLVSKIEGPIQPGELLMQLAAVQAEHEHELVTARLEKEEINQTRSLRVQQDQAYEESLKEDREKERIKKEAAEAIQKAEELERKEEEDETARINAILIRKSELRELLAKESPPDGSNPLALKLIAKLPTGSRIERTFLKTDSLASLYKFVFCHEECPHSFEIVTNFPRKVIECDESTTDTSIEEFGIKQSMIVFVNDLDA